MYDRFSCPDAIAYIKGGEDFPCLRGKVSFYQKCAGVLVVAKISGLPENSASGFFAMHIHAGDSCQGQGFAATGSHYDPKEVAHPRHAGDLPPLLLCRGGAFMAVQTDRFCVREIIGRTVVIHSGADDFVSQPAGNSGTKIACGVICRR